MKKKKRKLRDYEIEHRKYIAMGIFKTFIFTIGSVSTILLIITLNLYCLIPSFLTLIILIVLSRKRGW